MKHIFVIHEHHATHLHYDLRLEMNGVLKSWAVPKKPSVNPNIKRLAIQVNDHPLAYKDFEGTIPSGYGAGTVSIWDSGTYEISKGSLKEGLLHIDFHGKRLKGTFLLIRLKKSKQWLFKKKVEVKLFWPEENYTKDDLVHYYKTVAKAILPHLKDRPISMNRFPDGISGKSFFQKNLKTHPAWIQTTCIKSVNYLLVQNQKSLLFAANLAAIELHPFFSRIHKLANPDYLILDLDPKTAPFDHVIAIAQTIHGLLEKAKIPSFCKTSGKAGLHIAIPLGAKYSYKEAKILAKVIAEKAHALLPNISTLERSLSKRKGKVYIDYHQNDLGKTVVAPYSVRAVADAPVSTPLDWREVKKGLNPNTFTIKTVPKRLARRADLFAPVLKKAINLKTALKNLTVSPLKSGNTITPRNVANDNAAKRS